MSPWIHEPVFSDSNGMKLPVGEWSENCYIRQPSRQLRFAFCGLSTYLRSKDEARPVLVWCSKA
jgi:hypothetical protein